MSDPKSTLDKIQREIRENLKREDELKKGYLKLENENINNNIDNLNSLNENNIEIKTNGSVDIKNGSYQKTNSSFEYDSMKLNGDGPKTNGFRKFVPHNGSKGVMQKFIKSRANRLSMNNIRTSESTDDWYSDSIFDPPKINLETGKPIRKGYIPAEEKIEREVTDFQQREKELRNIRRKSQPDLMAALGNEEINEVSEWVNGFKEYKTSKHTKSMANLYQYQVDDDARSQDSSAPSSLKPARSLAELCDISDEETGSRTQSLIMQFESMQAKEGCV